MEGLATKQEVAAYLGIRPKTLDVWASQRKGPPFVKVEHARRYVWADVRAWVESKKVSH